MGEQDVKAPSTSDQALAARLREALRVVPGVIVGDVTNGEVTLTGVAPSAEIAADIVKIAATVEGVVFVNAERVAGGKPEPVDADDWPLIDSAMLEDVGVVKPVG